MRIYCTIHYHNDEVSLKNQLTEELRRIADKYEAVLDINDKAQEGQCTNCGEIANTLWTESLYKNGECHEIHLCQDCDAKYMDREEAEEIKLFQDFQEGRG